MRGVSAVEKVCNTERDFLNNFSPHPAEANALRTNEANMTKT